MAAWMRPRGALVGALAGASFLLFVVSADSEGRTRCVYSGPPGNLLTVTVDDGGSAEVVRAGRRIVVWEYLERPGRCRGGVPTVRNTDTIRVLLGRDDDVELLLRGGPLAPGATWERKGGSEIEIRIRGSGLGAVIGTKRADAFHWGPGPGNHAGLNLNPFQDRDIDVTMSGRDSLLIAEGRAGSDTIVPRPGALFPNDGVFSVGGAGDDLLIAPRNSYGILQGEGDGDLLVGGRRGDLFQGGGGHDRLIGDGGDDEIRAGPGRDLITSGPGRDRINSRDSKWKGDQRVVDPESDWVDCGTNRDRVKADRSDGFHGCEVIRRRE